MTLHYETVSDALLSILRKIMEADIFADFRLVGGTSCINDVEESPEGIDTLRPLEYWELKILDLKDAISQYCNDCNKEDGED